jgi:hypothetical protein
MYDFIYEQQDIYDHYDEEFENRQSSFYSSVRVRRPDLPLASALEQFDDILLQFDEKDMYSLANMRWYTNQFTFEQGDQK